MWPENFREQINQILGPEKDLFFKALESAPVTSLRQNPLKKFQIESSNTVPWCSGGYYLEHRPSFTLDPLFHAGCYYVQDASSMFLEQALKQTTDLTKPLHVLDLCGAPGGKTTHLLSLLNQESVLVTNEVIRSRVPVLSMNVEKWGFSNVIITNNDPSDFSALGGFFDVVVIDAPCSGEGLFRKDPEASLHWSLDAVNLCAARQQRILDAVWPAVKPGGLIIYSTCTFNEEENEDTISTALNKYQGLSLELRTEESWGVTKHHKNGVNGYRFYPHKTKGEGFFLSVLRKSNQEEESGLVHTKRKETAKKDAALFKNLLKESDRFLFTEKGGVSIAIPYSVAALGDQLSSKLTISHIGLTMGLAKQGKRIPDHALALSVDLKPGEFPEVDLNHDEAIRFLRKEPIVPTGSGITRFTHKGFGLGWGNVLPGRVNNMLPTSWRILK
jgi:16S rRNA C967 or C1407 C5-methylase (RsmB/RsmF family)/NOL1/NOP2/fmu family ribosome biogenesis protein